MFQNFISNMNPRRRKLFFIVLFVLVVVVFDRLLLSPSMKRLEALDKAVIEEEARIRADLQVLSRKDQVTSESRAFSAYYTDSVPTEEEVIAAFLKKLEMMASRSGVTLSKISTAGTDHRAEYLQFFSDIECSGPFESVVNYMHMIDSSAELVRITRFDLSPQRGETDDVRLTMTVSRMLMGSDPHRDMQTLLKRPGARGASGS